MFGSLFKSITDLDPTGLTGFAADTVDTAVGAAVGGAGMVARAGVSAVTSPIQTANNIIDGGFNLAARFVNGATITVQGVQIEIDSIAAANMLYAILIPKTAQAVLRGAMPSREDYVMDAMSYVGGPIEGIYVAATSKSAKLISEGKTPTAEQLGADMISALTPVALRKLGL